jgi:plastocyanin
MKNLATLVFCGLLISVSSFVAPHRADAAGWGTIKGKFVVDGAAPEAKPVDASKDAFCAKLDPAPIDESVVVGDSGGLANVVVFLRTGRNEKVDVHPDYDAGKDEPAVLDNKGCTFVPHITLVRVGQQFVVKNSDPVGHNTNVKLMRNGAANTIVAAGEENKRVLTKEEPTPMPVDCNIHPFMHGYVVVKDNPYMIVSADDGTFEIKNVPAGKREFEFWHEKPGRLKNLKYQGGALNRQGRANLTIADGQTIDLGEIKIPSSMLK